VTGAYVTFEKASDADDYLAANPGVESVVVGGITFAVVTDNETGQRIARSSVDALELIRLQPERYSWNAPTGVGDTPPSGHYEPHTGAWSSSDRAPGPGEQWVFDRESGERFIRTNLDAKEIVGGNPARFSYDVPAEAKTRKYERFVPDAPRVAS
jgi:hypothetical protein